MKASELAAHYGMKPHEENGLFLELDPECAGGQRMDSGRIYYYLGPLEKSVFHQLDCDEYWCYHAGTTLEVWVIGVDGKLEVKKLGTEKSADPLVYLPKGSIFAARHGFNRSDGTFLSCITVPQFRYEGSRLFTKEEMLEKYPVVFDFYRGPRR